MWYNAKNESTMAILDSCMDILNHLLPHQIIQSEESERLWVSLVDIPIRKENKVVLFKLLNYCTDY